MPNDYDGLNNQARGKTMAARTLLRNFAMMLIALAFTASSYGAFELMQIEQMMGGVNGDTSAQAIQLRMRASDQSKLTNARLVARDANGANPVVLIAFDTDLFDGITGTRVLITTLNFARFTDPTLSQDFIMNTPIPDSYLPAGKISYESDAGVILWSVSYGGSKYKGPNVGSTLNDPSGNFGPAFAGPLPSSSLQALRFKGTASASSTSNATDYRVPPTDAVFTNTSGEDFRVIPEPATLTLLGIGTAWLIRQRRH